MAADGSVYVVDHGTQRLRRIGPEGIITMVAGGKDHTNYLQVGDGGPATEAGLYFPSQVAVGPDGNVYISDNANHRVRRVRSPLPGAPFVNVAIASEDGTQLYGFDANGRHIRTVNTLTGAALYSFTYDDQGRLLQVSDGDGDVTSIERNAQGKPTALVAPFGQRTTLSLDGNGYLASVTNPAGEAYRMQYTADGLLTRFTDPKGQASTMSLRRPGLSADGHRRGRAGAQP